MNDLLGHAPNYKWDIARCDLRQWPDDGDSAKVGKRRCVWIMNWPTLYVTVVPHVWCCRWCGTLVSGWWYWRYESIFQLIPRLPIKKQVNKRKIDREIWDQRWPNWIIGISIRDFASPCPPFFPFPVSCFFYRDSTSLGLSSIEQWYIISTTIRMLLRHYLCHNTPRFIHET